jgi:hypothetical protein
VTCLLSLPKKQFYSHRRGKKNIGWKYIRAWEGEEGARGLSRSLRLSKTWKSDRKSDIYQACWKGWICMPVLPFPCCLGVKSTTSSSPSVNIHSLLLKGLFSLGCCDHDSLLESHEYRALFFLCRRESRFPLKSSKCGGNM